MSFLETKPTNGSYDQNLLASAPVATREEKQEGYNLDLLEAGRPRASASPPSEPSPASEHGATLANAAPFPARSPARAASKTPWYRTKTGAAGLTILALVIIGAIIGGAVGGTRHKHHSTSDSSSTTSSSSVSPSTSANGGLGQGTGGTGIGQGAASPSPTTTSLSASQGVAGVGLVAAPTTVAAAALGVS